MRQQQRIEPTDRNAKLIETHRRAAPSVNQKFLIARFDEGAWTKPIGTRNRRPRPEKRDAEVHGFGH